MFLPSSAFMSSNDPIELKRLNTGRPASRSEILERHMRDHRLNVETIAPDRSSQAGRNEHLAQNRRNTTHPTLNPVISIRRSLSRALIMVGERINPGAA